MSENLRGLYRREPRANRSTRIHVAAIEGERHPVTIIKYETLRVKPHRRGLPWESVFKAHAIDYPPTPAS